MCYKFTTFKSKFFEIINKSVKGQITSTSGADPGLSKKEGGGAPTSAEGASFLGGSGGMLPQKFLGI